MTEPTPADLEPPADRTRLRKRDLAAALAGPALVLVLLGVYLASPGQWYEGVELDGDKTLLLDDAHKGFYLTHILEERYREYQLVEMITFGCSVLAAGCGFLAAGLVFRQVRERFPDGGPLARWFSPGLLGVSALASLFFAGEEVNWGQTFARWGRPEFTQDAATAEQYTAQSIHNNLEGLSVQSMGSVFLIVVLVVLPIVWTRRKRLGLPAAWGPAIACWPAAATVASAYVLKEVKSVYRSAVGKDQAKLDVFYMGYLEQINEQKEMLLALALLLYLGYALARAWKARGEAGLAGA
jgi:hypothetical protein